MDQISKCVNFAVYVLIDFVIMVNAAGTLLYDLDLTAGSTPLDRPDITVIGGKWDNGWRVTEHGQRIILDPGKTISNGLLKVWFTKKGSAVNKDGARGQWLSLHEGNGGLDPEYVQLRSGREGYGFAKLRAKSNEKAVSKKSGALTYKRCEVKAGDIDDRTTDDTTVMQTTIRRQNGVVSFATPNGTECPCPDYWQYAGPYIINSLRYAYLGSDKSQNGASLPGLRFLRVKYIDLGGDAPASAQNEFDEKEVALWETAQWTVRYPDYEGNPFDLAAKTVFTHESSGEIRESGLYYDGDKTWRFRFTATQIGSWQFVTTRENEYFDNLKGTIVVSDNPDSNAHGFIKNFDRSWGWQGTEEAFVPQYVMGKDVDYYYDFNKDHVDTARIDADIQEFMIEHGFTGFHLRPERRWFNLKGEPPFENPDPRTYRVIETIIQKVHQLGGACFLWMWGSDGPRDKMDGSGPRGVLGGYGNEKDVRNLRYFAARLGPLPGWSMGYGIDTENAVATVEQLETWKACLEKHMGWDHFLGARVGYDEKGLWALRPPGPRPPKDENYCSEIKDDHCSWLGGDYTGYTSYRPMFDRYREAILHRPEKPSFEEDRFRLRNLDKWTYKDYNQERTRRGLWNSAMAGGVANIWGNLLPQADHGGSQPYDRGPVNIKHQIKTYSRFFETRFSKDLIVTAFSDSPTLRCLKTEDGSRIILYQENTDIIGTNELTIDHKSRMIAVDTQNEYLEIEIESGSSGGLVWRAPYVSDWAVAVGGNKN